MVRIRNFFSPNPVPRHWMKDNEFLPVFGEYWADDTTHHNTLGVHAVNQILGLPLVFILTTHPAYIKYPAGCKVQYQMGCPAYQKSEAAHPIQYMNVYIQPKGQHFFNNPCPIATMVTTTTTINGYLRLDSVSGQLFVQLSGIWPWGRISSVRYPTIRPDIQCPDSW